jgi:hypothetical protein
MVDVMLLLMMTMTIEREAYKRKLGAELDL